jgi:hypothetical protein
VGGASGIGRTAPPPALAWGSSLAAIFRVALRAGEGFLPAGADAPFADSRPGRDLVAILVLLPWCDRERNFSRRAADHFTAQGMVPIFP